MLQKEPVLIRVIGLSAGVLKATEKRSTGKLQHSREFAIT